MKNNKILLQYIFQNYLAKINNENNVNFFLKQDDSYFFQYHRLDSILPYLFFPNKTIDDEYYKKLLISNDKRYIKNIEQNLIALSLINLLNSHGVNYVFLKGLPLSNFFYSNISHRNFSDIDILVDENQLDIIEELMLDNNYKYGYFNKEKPVYVSREQILFKRTFTHELQNMIKIFHNSILTNIDINFKFSWIGNNKYSIHIPFNEIKNNISTNNEFLIPMLENELNVIHLICHFFNEAVFFLMNLHRDTIDTKELRLFRLLDICIVLKKCDISKVIDLSNKYKADVQVSYVLSIIYNFFDISDEIIPDISKMYNEFSISPLSDINYYYDKEGAIQQWPISFEDRILDLDKRFETCKRLFNIE